MAAVVGDINVGQDLSVSFQTDTGQVIAADTLGLVMRFSAKAENEKIKKTPISHGGKPRRRSIPNGWNGSVKIMRVNGNVTAFGASLMNDFHEAGKMRLFSISVSIVNRDDSLDEYLFQSCSLGDFDFGDWEANKEVEQEINFEAESMRIVSGGDGSYFDNQ